MRPTIFALSLVVTLAATSLGHAQELGHESVSYARRFRGATWAEKVNAAVAALPPAGGTVDAQDICLDKRLVTADTNVVLGSEKQTVRLRLGACNYPLGAHTVFYFSNTEVGGMGIDVPGDAGSTITHTGGGPGFSYGGSLQAVGVSGVYFHDFAIIGDGTSGSIGVDMTYASVSTLERINTNGSDNGWKFGGSSICSCYNQIIRVIAFDHSRGGWFSKTANQNQLFGGAVRADSASGVGLDIDGAGSNQIYSLDIESAAHYSIAFHKNGYNPNGNNIVNPYIEGAGPILISSGATYNAIIGTGGIFEGGSVLDHSGNTTNYIHQTGGGGGSDGIWPYHEVVQDALYFGLSPVNALKLLSSGVQPRGALELLWNHGIIAPQYGLSGHAPLEVGEAILHSGANIAGLVTTTMLANVAAPAVASKGVPGKTQYRYYLVCHDKNGGSTLPSPAGSVATGPATLSGNSYNQISWRPVDGCWSWDILKGNPQTALATFQQPVLEGSEGSAISFKDIGQATRPYIAPTRNTTGDLDIGGMSISEGIKWPLPETVVNGGSFYCPNCDPPVNPPTDCTASGVKTGSWVHGLNRRWICVP
jgi:hypothetical protein